MTADSISPGCDKLGDETPVGACPSVTPLGGMGISGPSLVEKPTHLSGPGKPGFLIYICNHQSPGLSHRSRHFRTLLSGFETASDGTYYGDLDGPNIALDHSQSEMRHQYHVWRDERRHAAFVGFEHYRRAFHIDILPDSALIRDQAALKRRKAFARDDRHALIALNEREFDAYVAGRSAICEDNEGRLNEWINHFDIVLPRPLFDLTVAEQFSSTHIAQHWDSLIKAVNGNSYFFRHENHLSFDIMRPSFFNMHIMRWELFNDYMIFWNECADALRKLLPDEPRILGHFSERIINLFVYQKIIEEPTISIGRIPIVYRE